MGRAFPIIALAASALMFVGVWVATDPARPAAPRDAVRGDAVYCGGCDDARAAGAVPIYEGQPGYRPEMDGDGDGIACEPFRGSVSWSYVRRRVR